ncbi:MAG: tetratricopeptide repeat protein [Candidatus Caenarcaniphilales bacterium]|nr:tetratricopeptide repeat protein [Candidatus Caenarcaniphilales bacterium]
MLNKNKPSTILPLTLLLLFGISSSIHTLQKQDKSASENISLKAYYPGNYGSPALSPMTPSMNPNAGMYFPPGYQQAMPGQMVPQQGGYPYPPQNFMPQNPMMGQMQPGMMGDPIGMGISGADPNDPVTQALSLHQAGRFADAIQIYESIIINNPPDPRIYASIADAHFRLGNSHRALKYAVEALKLDPNYASGHLLLGTVLGDMGDMVRAIRSYERVISLDQNNPYAYYNLGLIYYKQSDILTSIEYLERARDLNPNDPKIWNNLGVAYYDNGKLSEAAASYSQALALDPSYESARGNLDLVRPKLPTKKKHRAKKSKKRKVRKASAKNKKKQTNK